MMKYKKIIVMLVFLLAFMTIDGTVLAQSMTLDSESVLVDLAGNDVSISGKLKEINKDVTIIVYRNSDNVKSYIDQSKTNESGEYSFQFSLPNGTYKVVVSCNSIKYITNNIVVYKELEIISATISPDKANFDKNPSKQQDVTTTITYNDAVQVTNVKNGSVSIGSHNYSVVDNILKIHKTYLALQETGNLVLTIDFSKGNSATFMISITQTSNGEGTGGGGSGGTTKPQEPVPVLPINPVVNVSDITFLDTRNHWANEFIITAIDSGVVIGYGDNLFGPDDLITREQMAVIIVKLLKLDAKEYEVSFTDKDQISSWAKKYVSTAVNEKLLVGYPDDTFRPKSSATRAEAATVLLNALNSRGN